MKLAIQLAKRGLGQTGANPSVGCVIVKKNRIVGRGVTGEDGRPHAETIALAQAGNNARNATVFVTLEPCAHFGVTTPCVDRLIAAGVKRVVCPLTDPDPRVSGKGFKRLKSEGILLDFIPSAKAWAEDITSGFLSRQVKNRPYVTAKLGMSLDGKIATRLGTSKWITNEMARRRAQLLRVQADAILVGTKTFSIDNPSLNTRGSFSKFRTPLRLFLDRNLSVYPSESILKNLMKLPSILICGKSPDIENFKLWESKKIEILKVPEQKNKLDMKYLLKILAGKGINSLLIEGGGELIADLVSNNLIDKLVEYRAGVILGGCGVKSIGELTRVPSEINLYPKFIIKNMTQLDDNIEITWAPSRNLADS